MLEAMFYESEENTMHVIQQSLPTSANNDQNKATKAKVRPGGRKRKGDRPKPYGRPQTLKTQLKTCDCHEPLNIIPYLKKMASAS